jgi:acetate kinase
MKILVINSGSSSVKYQFFDTRYPYPLCKGIVERIGTANSLHTHQRHQKKSAVLKVNAPTHYSAIGYIFDILTNPASGVISSYRQISGIGHRVVHGGEIFTQPTIINERVIKTIEDFNELAPLHNPPALLSIRACMKFAKNIPQIAVFDTAFHQTMPQHAYVYGIPYEFYKGSKIRRYGFHGTSHKFVTRQAASVLHRPMKGLKIVTCHLGNGCSITAVNNGRSVDTSMGFTPLEGLLMGTRCGDVDVAVVLYLMEKKKINIKDMDMLLNKKSGLLGLSGVSNDMRDILKAVKDKNPRAQLALEIFLYRIKKYIGAYAAAMDGLDAVVLTAGIGENVPLVKARIAKDLRNLLSKFRTKVLVIPTNEELMIAQETAQVIPNRKP